MDNGSISSPVISCLPALPWGADEDTWKLVDVLYEQPTPGERSSEKESL